MRFILNVIYIAIIAAFAGFATTAHAGLFSTQPDLRPLLADPTPSIDGYTLDKAGLTTFYALRDYSYAWNPDKKEERPAFEAYINSVEHIVTYHGFNEADFALEKCVICWHRMKITLFQSWNF